MLVLVFKLKLITRFAERAGAWSTWSSWGSCSEPCGQGQHSRSRSCVSVNDTGVLADDCVGDDRMTRPCNEFDCPGDHTAEIVRQNFELWTNIRWQERLLLCVCWLEMPCTIIIKTLFFSFCRLCANVSGCWRFEQRLSLLQMLANHFRSGALHIWNAFN